MSNAPQTLPAEHPTELPPSIVQVLARLRRRIRQYLWVQGAAVVLAWLGLVFWGSLAVDWLLEPTVGARLVLQVLVLLLTLAVLYRWIVSRAFVRLPLESLAVVVERRYRQFRDGLVTSVELSQHPDHAEPFSPAMLERTRQEAQRQVGDVRIAEVFDFRPMLAALGAAVVLAASILVFVWQAPGIAAIWTRRAVFLSEELWPRTTHLAVVGFEDGQAIVPEGGDFELVVLATSKEEVPGRVNVSFQTDAGAGGNHPMNREGAGTPREQEFRYTFRNVTSSITFDVHGGDARVSDLRLQVVPNPIVESLTLACRYPAYTGRVPQELPTRSLEPLPVGTQVVIHGTANKTLRRLEVFDLLSASPDLPIQTLLPDQGLNDGRRFALDIGRIEEDRTLLFVLEDDDGIRSREPLRLELLVKPDAPPLVAVRREGVGTAVTARARVPLRGEITDDYGVERSWLEVTREGAEAQTVELVAPEPVPANPALSGSKDGESSVPLYETRLPVDVAVEMQDLEARVGQSISLSVRARDTYEQGPNVGHSEPFLLNIVSDEQLLEMLTGRELNLRRRFETVIKDLSDTRLALASMGLLEESFEQAAEAAREEESQPPPEPETPRDDASPSEPVNAEEQATLRKLRVQRALQGSRRQAEETLEIAKAFLAIREEVLNNRIDSERHRSALKESIADPLIRLAEEQYPPFTQRLEALQAHLADSELAVEDLTMALREADAILVRMHQILDQMVELETFNEVLATLRVLIDSQQNMTQQTKEQHLEALRRLLELD